MDDLMTHRRHLDDITLTGLVTTLTTGGSPLEGETYGMGIRGFGLVGSSGLFPEFL